MAARLHKPQDSMVILLNVEETDYEHQTEAEVHVARKNSSGLSQTN